MPIGPVDFLAAQTGLGYIRVSGADAAAFLQGQLSNDIQRLTASRAQLSCHSSAKGRVLFVAPVLRDGEDYLLELPRELLAQVLKRLRLFVLRAKVIVNEVGERELGALGLAGPAASAALQSAGLPVPSTDWEVAEAGALRVLRRPAATPVFSVMGAADALSDAQSRLAAHLRAGSRDDWHLRRLLDGVPTVGPQTQDHFVAQMLNLDTLDAISFTKGCYTGQEVIARLHYLGKLKKRLYLGYCDAAAAPGSDVFAEHGDGQSVGEVADTAAMNTGFAVQLVLQSALAGAAGLRLGAADGPAIRLIGASPAS